MQCVSLTAERIIVRVRIDGSKSIRFAKSAKSGNRDRRNGMNEARAIGRAVDGHAAPATALGQG